ncbi:MAG: DNA helicase II / ATP-dependent DNA helicase PcrA [Parcubacteria bacterium C7867-005]|nr:MAG: DNA helicase II / ATP-dependent DNA helicase PcrA [Parcubacteria bacterium C7867-005]
MDDIFNKAYKSLNKSQKEAVDTIDGPVMVVAGPGTGKTTVLTLRIANILKQTDTPPSGILAITYTDAGVKAMRGKLRGLIGTRAHEVEMHTFHSFAKAMMNEYQDHFIETNGMKQMTDVDKEMLVRDILEDQKFKDLRPSGKPDAYLSGIISSISNCKRDAITPENVRQHADKEIDRITKDEDSISTRGKSKGKLKADAEEKIEKCKKTLIFADIYERYEEGKKKSKKLDFDDLIINLLVTLKNDELFLRLLQERFLYILVDEHQDTNDAQNYIISLLAEFFETPNVFIVGDEKQAIYRFQGASVENFLLLRKRWSEMKLISLEANYRSHQSILDSSFSVIEKNYIEGEHDDLRIKLLSQNSESERPIELVSVEDVRTMENYLVEELKRISTDEPDASIAIITKRNKDLERVIKLLEFNTIPVSSERSVDIFHHPIGVMFFDLITFVNENDRYEYLARTLTTDMWNLRFDQSINLSRALKAGKFNELQTIEPALKEIRSNLISCGPIEFIIKLAQISGFAGLVSKDPSYVYVWRGIVSLAESLTREAEIENPHELLGSMLAYRESAKEKAVKVSVGAPDLRIKALTAHGSKGLEFDYVFIPFATEEAWVGRNHGSSFILPTKDVLGGDIKDTRRLFYVGLTRAKKHVIVLTPLEESDGKALTPLRFVAEIESGATSVSIPRMQININPEVKQNNQSNYDSKVLALAKDLLMKNGLSVTALNHYLECPNKFIYESILKMPQAPSISSTRGTAMHEALSHIWTKENRSVLDNLEIEKIITEMGIRSVDDTFLSSEDKDLVKQDINEDAPIVARELGAHLKSSGTVYTEKWLEASHKANAVEEGLYIPIHGKLDVIIDKGDTLSVFDYKSKQAMSVNEIKGETKNSNGDYFRQLVFYKILALANPKWKLKKSSFSLVFIRPDKKERCPVITLDVTNEDVDKVNKEINSLVGAVWHGGILSSTCGKDDCEYCSLRQILKH